MTTLYIPLGRNVDKILKDTENHFGRTFENVCLVCRENDPLTPAVNFGKRKVTCVNIRKDGTLVNEEVVAKQEDVIVLNGGTTPQTVALLIWITRGGSVGRMVDVQRDWVSPIAAAKNKNLRDEILCACSELWAFNDAWGWASGDHQVTWWVARQLLAAIGKNVDEFVAEEKEAQRETQS